MSQRNAYSSQSGRLACALQHLHASAKITITSLAGCSSWGGAATNACEVGRASWSYLSRRAAKKSVSRDAPSGSRNGSYRAEQRQSATAGIQRSLLPHQRETRGRSFCANAEPIGRPFCATNPVAAYSARPTNPTAAYSARPTNQAAGSFAPTRNTAAGPSAPTPRPAVGPLAPPPRAMASTAVGAPPMRPAGSAAKPSASHAAFRPAVGLARGVEPQKSNLRPEEECKRSQVVAITAAAAA